MKWVKSVVIEPEQSIESRLKEILLKMYDLYGHIQFIVYDIDVTGKLGNELTQKTNRGEKVLLDVSVFIALLEEDGQVFELDAYTNEIGFCRILITDGIDLEFLGSEDSNAIIGLLGKHSDLDPELFASLFI